MKNTAAIILVFLLCRVSLAQNSSLYFEKIGTQNGLSNDHVNCILQDQRGFIWIGTDDGLNRYDGQYFVIFRNRPGDSTSISGNMISGLHEDKDGVLWISTLDGGISKYDHRKPVAKQFRQYKNIPGDSLSIPINAINALVEDKQNNLWLASAGFNVIRFNKQTGKFDRPVAVGPRTVLDLETDGQGIIWVGKQGGGLLKIDPVTLKHESDKRYEDLYAQLPHVTITTLFCDKEKNMWYGSWDKILYKYDVASKREIAFQQNKNGNSFINDEITSFGEDAQGRIWIGCRTRGLQLFDKTTQQFHNYEHNPAQEGSVAGNNIRCIYIDRTGKTWIGTNKGISISNPIQQQFRQTFLPLPANSGNDIVIYDFYKDEKEDLWIGTNAGIYLQPKNSNTFIHRPLSYKGNPLLVSKFFKGSDGTFYIGTNYSFFVYDRIKNAIQLLPNTEKDLVMSQIISSRVVSVVEDRIDDHPVLIVSPYGHFLAYYDLVEKQWVSRRDSVKRILEKFNIKDNLVRKLYKTSSGNIWLANAQQGLGEWVTHSQPAISFYKNDPFRKEGLSNNNVYDIAEDAQKNLWISTYGGGLHYMDASTKKIQHLPATDNLLEGIMPDEKGNVWMISNGSLQKYDKGLKSSSSFHLPDIYKSGGVSGYMYRDEEGKIYVAGKNYFIRFDPDSVKDYRRQPGVFLTDFKIFNESYGHLLEEKTIRLGYRQNYFTLEFSAPDFSLTEPMQYSYMLEGWDKGWVDNGTRNFATFSNLEGGTYTFRVRASNNPGTWSEQEQRLTIVIVPPFWKRGWFYLLCALVAGGSAYAVYRYRINELLKRQAIRNKIAQDLHDSVGSTLSSISVYSQVAKIYKQKNQEDELQDTLEKIGNTSGEMISEMSDIVWAINPRNDSMEKIIQRMESFARPLLQTRNISLKFDYDKAILYVNLPMEDRKNFYLIFKEAVNNALKYSDCRNLRVSIQYHQSEVQLTVRDDGKGFDTEKLKTLAAKSLSGNGLNNMKRRAAEMKGKCWIESAPEKGTTVHLHFPVT